MCQPLMTFFTFPRLVLCVFVPLRLCVRLFAFPPSRTLLVLLLLAACRATPAPPADLPSASPSPRPSLRVQPTVTPRLITPPTASPLPSTTPAPPTETLLVPTALLLSPAAPPDDPAAVVPETVIGYSLAGRPLVLRRFSSGGAPAARSLLLVGGMHGGWEANTVALMEQLSAHFTDAPAALPPGVDLLIVPLANPDGYPLGRVSRGRFNGAGVDLNRNWACGWSPEAYWREQRVDPGAQPFSEPETRALADFMRRERPAGVLFFHSAANGVFAGECNGDHGSDALAAAFGDAAGYPHESPFTAYPVTGTAASWADGEGIPAADVELRSSTDPEFDRNLRGVLALLHWLASS